MELRIKAVATATEQGLFTAVVSADTVDLEGDVVNPLAMVKAFEKWSTVERTIPLTWNHSGAPEDIIGEIRPETAKAINGEVHVDGWIDQATPRGAEVWRLVKSGTLGFSYGAMVPNDGYTKNAHGGMDVSALDIFEVTATATPMNKTTRVVSWKGIPRKKALQSAIEEALESAGRAAYGTPDIYVSVEDYDPDAGFVIFCSSGPDMEETYTRVSFTLAEDGSAVLGSDAADVQRQVTYKSQESLRKRADDTALSVLSSGLTLKGERADPAEAIREVLATEFQTLRDQISAQAAEITELRKTVDGQADESPRTVDPLRKQADAVALEVATGGRLPIGRPEPTPEPPDLMDLDALKRKSRDLMLQVHTGMDDL